MYLKSIAIIYLLLLLFIFVTRIVKRYNRFIGKYVTGRRKSFRLHKKTGRRKRFRPHKEYIFLIRITSRVDLAMSICPYGRCDIKAAVLGLGMQILKLPVQRKFVSSVCHTLSNAHKAPNSVAITIFMLKKNLN